MRVLVTGGAGFIGSHVVDAVAASGHEPVLFDVAASVHHSPREVESVIGSVLDPEALTQAMIGCDAVIHLAAAADVDDVTRNPVRAEQLNSRGTLNVLEAARTTGVRRVLYASTIWVYGASESAHPLDEDAPLGAPDHLYTATKLAGEMYCGSYASLYGLDCTILRFGIPYGPRARPEAVVPAFVGRALAGETLTIAGSGEQCRRFVYVEDLAAGVAAALRPEAANRIYNLTGDADVSISEIAQTVSEIVGDTEICHVPARAGDFNGVEVSGERALRELGWRADTPFSDGVRRYVDWRREEEALEAARRGAAGGRGHSNRDWSAAAGLIVTAQALVGAYLLALHLAGDDALQTMLATSVIAATLVALSNGMGGPASARHAWLVAFAAVAVVLIPGLRPLVGLEHVTASLVLLAAAVAGLSVTLAVGAIRQLTALREPADRPADSG